MTGLRFITLSAALGTVMLAPSCRVFRKTPPTSAPASAPAPPPIAVPAVKPKQAPLPAPPQIAPQDANLEQEPPAEPVEALPPPPRRSRGSRVAHTRETPEAPAEQAPAPAQAEEPPPVPQLEQILTPEQRQAYLEEIDANVSRAQRSLDSVQGRHLTPEQKTDLARIREFIRQAKESRTVDLFRARNISERASILAEDLIRGLQ